ncbi:MULTISPECIES: DNA repair protein RecN [unclassified Luteococcus]|uniref:DNA repair protein RecN n=1 Tax=unclassified Luteococcus TaxID=2639923 RepID=UPI00313BE7F9
MLTELRIEGLGVIAETGIEFHPGMTAVTGETGAGKTMVVSSLGLLMGARADSGVVRHGARRALVEGRFTGVASVTERVESAGGLVEDGELLLARQVSSAGRSRAFVGGAQSSVGALAEISGELATIHGQSEQIRLGTPERQREVLDRFCGSRHAAALRTYRADFERRGRLATELAELETRARERAREQDLLRFGLDEIAAVEPQPGEDEALAAEANRLQAVDDLRQLAETASAALSGSVDGYDDAPGVVGLFGQARKAMEQAETLDPAAAEVARQMREAGFQLNEAAAQVAGYLADLDADPLRLEAIAERRAALAGLQRKYGETIDDVLEWSRTSAARLTDLLGSDDRIEELRAEIGRLDDSLAQQASALTQTRTDAAERLATAVQSELAALAMPHARLGFELRPTPELTPHGAEQVQLTFAANPGLPAAPLGKVASGGELSRVRLALEVVLVDADAGEAPGAHTCVFDEVDAGVGGAVAVEIGRRLAMLARHCQVIVVTHLAQVAAFADAHHVVSKSTNGEVTVSDLRQVTGDERLAELARMMGGISSSESSLAHARELLEAAGQD